jgi:hypothetical protein
MAALTRALACWAVSPGAHLLLTVVVERRPVHRREQYPAVLVGDTALAVSAGLARWAAGPGPGRPGLRRAAAAGGLASGAWQLRREIRSGFVSRPVAYGPTKLWHQFVIYPVLTGLVAEPLVDGTRAALRPAGPAHRRAAVAAAWAGVALWAGLVVEAWHHPRAAHGPWPGRSG